MPVKKNPETGEVTEEPTRFMTESKVPEQETHPRRGSPPRGSDAPTVGAPARGGSSGRASRAAQSAFEAPTQPIDAARPSAKPATQDGRTVLHRPGGRTTTVGPADDAADDAMADPPVGWLVVLEGPGKGRMCKLGYGTNSLGRGENARVRLDFGDEQISRENHAVLTYDVRGRKFYLQHGGGVNLTRIGDAPVLVPTVLEPMQDILVGGTTLRFVPFCGPDFDWQDVSEE